MDPQRPALPDDPPLPEAAVAAAAGHLEDILRHSLEPAPGSRALLVADARCALARGLAEAWHRALPSAEALDFDTLGHDRVRAAFEPLVPGDLVVLVQSDSFRLQAFRIRVELFARGIKVVEHPHLERMRGPEALRYVEALAYDPAYYRGVGGALKARIDKASRGAVDSFGARLLFDSPFEDAKLNVGDYRGMRNTGGQFPIGEVFTEARDLERVSGRMRVSIFADIDFRAAKPAQPITLVIEKGRVTGTIDSTPEFDKVLEKIRADEGEVWVRELGFGMNRAFSADRMVSDIGTLERMCGIHLSLGAKHAVYPKEGFSRRAGRHHVDVFADTEAVWLDDERVFADGAWTVGTPDAGG
jgi:hypothetical protein